MPVFTCKLQVLFVSLGVCLLFDNLRELRLKLRRYDSRVVVELLKALHYLLGEGLIACVTRAGHIELIGLNFDPFRKVPVYVFVLVRWISSLSMLAVVSISLQLMSFLRLSTCILAHIASLLLAIIIHFKLEADCAKLLLLWVSIWLVWLLLVRELLILRIDCSRRRWIRHFSDMILIKGKSLVCPTVCPLCCMHTRNEGQSFLEPLTFCERCSLIKVLSVDSRLA